MAGSTGVFRLHPAHGLGVLQRIGRCLLLKTLLDGTHSGNWFQHIEAQGSLLPPISI
jgi:hypothetical protein